jgi:hypothetical protein
MNRSVTFRSALPMLTACLVAAVLLISSSTAWALTYVNIDRQHPHYCHVYKVQWYNHATNSWCDYKLVTTAEQLAVAYREIKGTNNAVQHVYDGPGVYYWTWSVGQPYTSGQWWLTRPGQIPAIDVNRAGLAPQMVPHTHHHR